jgi:stringent starvation protein B
MIFCNMLGVKVPPQQGQDTDLPLNISSTEEACVSLSDDGCDGCVVM